MQLKYFAATRIWSAAFREFLTEIIDGSVEEDGVIIQVGGVYC